MRGARRITCACALVPFALASGASATTIVTVEISGFAFRPDVLTITAENSGLGQSSSLWTSACGSGFLGPASRPDQ